MKYDLEIIYSDRRTLSINIKDGKVIVRAPKGTSNDVIKSLILKHSEWIEKHIYKSIEKEKLYSNLDEKEIKALKASAREYFTRKTEYYSKIMGLKYSRTTITSAKTRFGSCSSRGNIAYSYRLMLYPEIAREYVVVHELAHLIELNHSKKFYKIIEKYIPDYKERRRLLK